MSGSADDPTIGAEDSSIGSGDPVISKVSGKRTLYYATTRAIGERIIEDGEMANPEGGPFGMGFYFSKKPETAQLRARGSNQCIIEAEVNMGKTLILEGPVPDLTIETLRELQCDSVQGRTRSDEPWLYVVYGIRDVKKPREFEFSVCCTRECLPTCDCTCDCLPTCDCSRDSLPECNCSCDCLSEWNYFEKRGRKGGYPRCSVS
jgi:hypothetical protein